MKAVALLAVVSALLAQPNPTPRALLNAARPLTPAEIAIVLGAARDTLAGRTLRLSPLSRNQDYEGLMGGGGQPKIIRVAYAIEAGMAGGLISGSSTPPAVKRWREDVILIIEYTGRPARRCDASSSQGEMVIEYQRRSPAQQWTAAARARDARDPGNARVAQAFAMLPGGGDIVSGEPSRIGGRSARPLVSAWKSVDSRAEPPLRGGDPLPDITGEPARVAMQFLWIDTESLLPLRWEVSRDGEITHGFDFVYEPIDILPPEGVEPPACIPQQS